MNDFLKDYPVEVTHTLRGNVAHLQDKTLMGESSLVDDGLPRGNKTITVHGRVKTVKHLVPMETGRGKWHMTPLGDENSIATFWDSNTNIQVLPLFVADDLISTGLWEEYVPDAASISFSPLVPPNVVRRLATVREIHKIIPLFDKTGQPALSVEGVLMDGWFSIVQKGQFTVGSKVLYLEIDTILNPDLSWVKEYASFMGKHHWHLKTLKLNGLRLPDKNGLMSSSPPISQGLVLPVEALRSAICATNEYKVAFNKYVISGLNNLNYIERAILEIGAIDWNSDALNNEYLLEVVTQINLDELMGLTKYERPIKSNGGNSKGTFPSYIRKTDEERIQNLGKNLEAFQNRRVIATYKMDGSSTTVWLGEDDQIHIASRTLERHHDGVNHFSQAVLGQSGIEPLLRENPNILAVQGETIGEGIQGNPHRVKGYKLVVFNLVDRKTGYPLPYDIMAQLCEQYQIDYVRAYAKWDTFNMTVNDCLELVSSLTVIDYDEIRDGRSKWAEGLVFRLNEKEPGILPSGAHASFKVINPNYLLDNNE